MDEEDEKIDQFLSEHEQCFDRFTFDEIFRFLLKHDFDHEDAKDIIIDRCALSALVFQERIYNNYYLKIKVEEEISGDLQELKNEIEKEYLKKVITDLINKP